MTGSNMPSPEQLELLAQIVSDVARFRRLPPEDARDFAQSVQVRLIERDYDVFREYQGRSSLKTYLIVVVHRLLLDWRNSTGGRWRPSAAARRLGGAAVALERLIHRDGHTASEAIEIVRGGAQAPAASELDDLIGRLPQRERRRWVSEDALDEQAVGFDDPIEAAEEFEMSQRTRNALRAALSKLSADDRRLVSLRYFQNRSVQSVAELLHVPAKPLYRRFERVLRSLRDSMATAAA